MFTRFMEVCFVSNPTLRRRSQPAKSRPSAIQGNQLLVIGYPPEWLTQRKGEPKVASKTRANRELLTVRLSLKQLPKLNA